MELVDHDVFQLRAYLLKDERRVAAVDKLVEQLLGVAEQESVLLVVQLAHLFLDAPQQTELREVAQRQVGALVQLPLAGLLLNGLSEQVAQRGVGQMADEVSLRVRLLAPLLGLSGAVGGAFGQCRLVKYAIL